MEYTQNVPARRRFFLVSDIDHITGKTGASPTVQLMKAADVAFSAGAGTVGELSNGWYYYDPASVDVSVLGALAFHIEGTGCDPQDFEDYVVPANPLAGSDEATFTPDSALYYGSLADAMSYFDGRLENATWLFADDDRRVKALITATRLIDNLNFAGDKADSDQALEFPRGTDTVIPKSIRAACYEIAYHLLEGADTEMDNSILAMNSVNYTGVQINYDPEAVQEARAHMIPSIIAWCYLRPFLRSRSEVTLVRIN